jgi:hypothetical protein
MAHDENSSAMKLERAAGARRTGFVAEFVAFLGNNKKWWLAPILIAVVLLGGLVVLGGTGAAPFIYTLF